MPQPIASTVVNGIEFSVLAIDINKKIICPGGCPYSEDSSCEHRNKSMRNPKKGSLICTLIKLNIKNFTDTPFEIHHFFSGFGESKIIDYKGFSFDPIYFCDAPEVLLKNNFINSSGYKLMPKAQVNTIFAFPELNPNTSIHRFTYSTDRKMWDLVVGESEFEKNAPNETETKTKGITPKELLTSLLSSGEGNYSDTKNLNDIENNIKQLKIAVFKRFNNVLNSKEKVYLENSIQNLIFHIDISIEELSPSIKSKILPGYSIIKEDLLENRNKEQEKEKLGNERKIKLAEIMVKAKAILDLSPEAFEEYIASLFSCMGYKVELTSRTRDKGVDIFLHKDDKKIAVQCKKYSKKNLIGSPDMQGFLGAIHNSKSVKGIFITTSFFTLEAEKFARNNPIELIDSVKLKTMIAEILLQIEGDDSTKN